MCTRTTCKRCQKATWSGCGQHKNEVLRGVPKNERCSCTAAQKAEFARERSLGARIGRMFGKNKTADKS